jgi:hypothetical protein
VRRSEDDDDELEPKQVPCVHAPYTTHTHARTNAGQGGPPVHMQTGPVATPPSMVHTAVCMAL